MVNKTVWRSALSFLVGFSVIRAAVATVHSRISVIFNLKPHTPPNSRLEITKMNYDTKRSGAYIQNLRIQNGYTQGQLAKMMNMDRSHLSRIESGAKGCSVDLFIQLSEFFHVTIDSLIFGMERDDALKNESKAQLKKEIAILIDHLTMFQTLL